jgi:hypothetical protein
LHRKPQPRPLPLLNLWPQKRKCGQVTGRGPTGHSRALKSWRDAESGVGRGASIWGGRAGDGQIWLLLDAGEMGGPSPRTSRLP